MTESVGVRGIGMTSQRTRQRLVAYLRDAGIRDERVLQAIVELPRHLFVDEALASRAYENTALPIGFGQTISQPFIVARMTEAVLTERLPGKVLEIGTGSGYQTAVLASVAERVFSVERIGALLTTARQRLQTLGLSNVRYKHDDGSVGWSRYGPYDGILVTAAATRFPDDLLDQLAVGAALIAPVGPAAQQELIRVERTLSGFERRSLGAVSFVPLLGGVR